MNNNELDAIMSYAFDLINFNGTAEKHLDELEENLYGDKDDEIYTADRRDSIRGF